MQSFDSTKKQVLDRTDILALVSEHVTLKSRGRNWVGLCPFHNEKTPSFTVSSEKGFYHCFGCSAHGSALDFLMEHDHLEFVDAVEELASICGVDVPREDSLLSSFYLSTYLMAGIANLTSFLKVAR